MDNIWLLRVIAVHFEVDLDAHVYMYNMFCFLFYFYVSYICISYIVMPENRAETNAVLFPFTPFVEMTKCPYPQDTKKNQIFQTGVIQMMPSTQNPNYDENISRVLIVEDTI